MKRGLLVYLSLCLFSIGAMAQATYPDSLKAEPSKELDFAMEVLKRMTDPNMEGRGYAKNGDKIAADYIMNEFMAIGLKPMGKDFFQKFDVSVNTFPEKVSMEIDGVALKPGVDFLVDAACPSVTGTFKPVFISRQQINDRMKLMDKLRDAKESFILVDNTNRTGETPEMSKKIDALVDKMITDEKVSLRGVIIYNKGRKSWSTSTTQAVRPVLYIAKESDLEDAKEIKLDVVAKFESKYETQNVFGMIEGAVKKDSFIVIASHYDNLGLMGSDTRYAGANNSASGVAMMLSLAKHFSIIKPAYSMIFIAFSGSELGFAGANAFVNNGPIKPEQIKFMINFDLMGNGSAGIKIVNADKFESKVKEIEKISKSYKLLPSISGRPSAPISDHYVFDQKGVPSFFIYSLGGSFAYHNLDDAPEALPFTKFANTQNLMIRFLETFK